MTLIAFMRFSRLSGDRIGRVNHMIEYGFDAFSESIAFLRLYEIALILSLKEPDMPRRRRPGRFNKAWRGWSGRADACDCGAGVPCEFCNGSSRVDEPSAPSRITYELKLYKGND